MDLRDPLLEAKANREGARIQARYGTGPDKVLDDLLDSVAELAGELPGGNFEQEALQGRQTLVITHPGRRSTGRSNFPSVREAREALAKRKHGLIYEMKHMSLPGHGQPGRRRLTEIDELGTRIAIESLRAFATRHPELHPGDEETAALGLISPYHSELNLLEYMLWEEMLMKSEAVEELEKGHFVLTTRTGRGEVLRWKVLSLTIDTAQGMELSVIVLILSRSPFLGQGFITRPRPRLKYPVRCTRGRYLIINYAWAIWTGGDGLVGWVSDGRGGRGAVVLDGSRLIHFCVWFMPCRGPWCAYGCILDMLGKGVDMLIPVLGVKHAATRPLGWGWMRSIILRLAAARVLLSSPRSDAPGSKFDTSINPMAVPNHPCSNRKK